MVRARVLTVRVLARPGTPSTSRWPLRQDGDQHPLQEVVLADHHLLDLVEDAAASGRRRPVSVSASAPSVVSLCRSEAATGPTARGGVLDRHRKADADEHALLGRVEDAGDDADHLAVAVDQRPARIARIGRRVELDQVLRAFASRSFWRVAMSRFRPETTPAETDGPMPKGKPTATTSSPGFMPAGGDQGGRLQVVGHGRRGVITARSSSGWAPTI